jgi:hypothetical protein
MNNLTNKKNIIILVVVLAVLVGGYYGWTSYKASQNTPEAQAAQLEAQKTAIIAKIKQLTVIPEEQPVLFTVNDANLLKSQQAFFKDSANGDVLLVFQTSGKALIYREATNQIINSGPVSFQQPTSATSTKK